VTKDGSSRDRSGLISETEQLPLTKLWPPLFAKSGGCPVHAQSMLEEIAGVQLNFFDTHHTARIGGVLSFRAAHYLIG
jgi:hypothetical protein